MTEEVWAPVLGYEGLYEVSNAGQVRSIDRTVPFGRGGDYATVFKKGRILKPCVNHQGRPMVGLAKGGKTKLTLVHKLVAEAFICPRPENKEVNHINGVKHDNRVENLEWLTHKENIKHSWDTGLNSLEISVHKSNEVNRKPIINTITGVVYKSVAEAAKLEGIKRTTLVMQLTGKNKNTSNLAYYGRK